MKSFGGPIFAAGVLIMYPDVALSHGTVISPAFRYNPNVADGYCPWCQGSQSPCSDADPSLCEPPSPCWGSDGSAGTVQSDKYRTIIDDHLIDFSKAKHPDGSHWIDQNGGPSDPAPLWCPGDNMKMRYYINADHNGVYRWESQLAEPGAEEERAFQNFTDFLSVNNYYNSDGERLTNYFMVTKPKEEITCCTNPEINGWSERAVHCCNDVLAETNLTLPAKMPAGKTVIRWRWHGGMDKFGSKCVGGPQLECPERSLFVSCKDVVVGTAEECAARGAARSVELV